MKRCVMPRCKQPAELLDGDPTTPTLYCAKHRAAILIDSKKWRKGA